MYLQMLLGLDGMHVWQEQPTIMAMRSWKCFERCYTHSPIQTDRDTQALLLAAQIAQIMSWSYVLFSLRCQTACYSADAMEDHLLLGIVLSSLFFFIFYFRVAGCIGQWACKWLARKDYHYVAHNLCQSGRRHSLEGHFVPFSASHFHEFVSIYYGPKYAIYIVDILQYYRPVVWYNYEIC